MADNIIDIGFKIKPILYLHVGKEELCFDISNISEIRDAEDGTSIVTYENVEYNVFEDKPSIDAAFKKAVYYREEAIKHLQTIFQFE
jgi:hypothetical protein